MNTTIASNVETSGQASLPGYEVKLKVESIDMIKESDKTKLEHAYSIWALIKQKQHY